MDAWQGGIGDLENLMSDRLVNISVVKRSTCDLQPPCCVCEMYVMVQGCL